MGGGASKPQSPEAFSSLAALSPSEASASGAELNGKRIQVVGRVAAKGALLRTPFGGSECVVGEIVGRTKKDLDPSYHIDATEAAAQKMGVPVKLPPAVVRVEMAAGAFKLCDGDAAEVHVMAPSAPNSTALQCWLKPHFKEHLRCDPTRSLIVVGGKWDHSYTAKAGFDAYAPCAGGVTMPVEISTWWEGWNKKSNGKTVKLMDPVKDFNMVTRMGDVRYLGDNGLYSRGRMCHEMLVQEGDLCAVVGDAVWNEGLRRLELHPGQRGMLVSNSKKAEQSLAKYEGLAPATASSESTVDAAPFPLA